MPRVITIDPGKSKCGLVLAEISEKKVYKAIILKSELLENYVRNLIAAEEISQIIIGNGTTSRENREKLYFLKKEILSWPETKLIWGINFRNFLISIFPASYKEAHKDMDLSKDLFIERALSILIFPFSSKGV